MSEEKKKSKFTITYRGPSRDHRTNRWEFTCECGKTFEPNTTMLARKHEQCPKCKHEEEIDYNNLP